MSKNLKQQITYAVRANFRERINKHALQMEGIRDDGRPKSYRTLKNQLDTAKQFASWEMTKHPEIKNANDIEIEHVNEWLTEMGQSGKWHTATAAIKTSQMKAIIKNMQRTFGYDQDGGGIKKPLVSKKMRQKVRDKAMDIKDINILLNNAKEGSTVHKAIVIALAGGLRAAEISRLKADDIDICDNGMITIHVQRAKNGKSYDVQCIDATRNESLAKLKNNIKDTYIFCSNDNKPLKPDSIQKSLLRAMQAADIADKYPRTGFHAIRKEWAQRTYDIYRASHTEQETRAFVSVQLGHSDTRGEDNRLMRRYVNNIY